MGGRAAINIPSNHRENVIFMDHQKMKPPNSTVPKDAATKWPMKVLHAGHERVSVEAPGRGEGVTLRFWTPNPPPPLTVGQRPPRGGGWGWGG